MMNYMKTGYQTIIQDVTQNNLDKGEQRPQFLEYRIGYVAKAYGVQ
jgi:hypothetical protein